MPAHVTDANTDGAWLIAASTSGDEATVCETPSLACLVLAPLHYAVRERHANIVQLLLQHGTAIELPDDAAFWSSV